MLRRFLERNPNEVVFIVIQDELPAEELLPVLTRVVEELNAQELNVLS